ncbi:MAG: hypothetical protein P8Y60_17860, partial [Calditrichota bacterium]
KQEGVPKEKSPGQQDPNHPENLNTYDLSGANKQHIDDLLRTIEQMRKMKAGSQSKGTPPEAAGTTSIGNEQDRPLPSSHAGEPAPDTGSEPPAFSDDTMEDDYPQEDITIPRRMATLTFVEVLKAQGLYENALAVLKMIPKTPSNADRIEQEWSKLTSLLEIQQQE